MIELLLFLYKSSYETINNIRTAANKLNHALQFFFKEKITKYIKRERINKKEKLKS